MHPPLSQAKQLAAVLPAVYFSRRSQTLGLPNPSQVPCHISFRCLPGLGQPFGLRTPPSVAIPHAQIHLHRRCSHYGGGLPGGVVPGDDGRYSWAEFSLTAAKRLARGSRASSDSSSLRRDESPSPLLNCRGRLGCLSPVDSRIICSVRHPGVDRSWKDSARSLPTATRQRMASSS